MMQLHKLCKYASELEQSGGRRGGVEVEGVGGSQRWAEKGKGGHTMTDLQGDLHLVFFPHEDLQAGKEQRSGQSTNLHYLWHIPQISQKSKLLLSSALIWTNRFLPVRLMTSRGLCLQCGNHGVWNLCSQYLVVGASRRA